MKHNKLVDKKVLQDLVKALSITRKKSGRSVIQKDIYGDYIIKSEYGFLYSDGRYLYISIVETVENKFKTRQWTWVKKELPFMEFWQDGDIEGVLRLERMPNSEEAEKIRNVMNLRKRSSYTPTSPNFLVWK